MSRYVVLFWITVLSFGYLSQHATVSAQGPATAPLVVPIIAAPVHRLMPRMTPPVSVPHQQGARLQAGNALTQAVPSLLNAPGIQASNCPGAGIFFDGGAPQHSTFIQACQYGYLASNCGTACTYNWVCGYETADDPNGDACVNYGDQYDAKALYVEDAINSTGPFHTTGTGQFDSLLYADGGLVLQHYPMDCVPSGGVDGQGLLCNKTLWIKINSVWLSVVLH